MDRERAAWHIALYRSSMDLKHDDSWSQNCIVNMIDAAGASNYIWKIRAVLIGQKKTKKQISALTDFIINLQYKR